MQNLWWMSSCTYLNEFIVSLFFSSVFRNVVLEKEDGEEFVIDVVADIVDSAINVIYDNYIQKQLYPYVVDKSRELFLHIIEVKIFVLYTDTVVWLWFHYPCHLYRESLFSLTDTNLDSSVHKCPWMAFFHAIHGYATPEYFSHACHWWSRLYKGFQWNQSGCYLRIWSLLLFWFNCVICKQFHLFVTHSGNF